MPTRPSDCLVCLCMPSSTRKELASCRKEGEEVKCRLRHQEAAAAASRGAQPTVGGLCLKCAQHEAVLAETHSNMHVQAIDRLTKYTFLFAQIHLNERLCHVYLTSYLTDPCARVCVCVCALTGQREG